MEVARARFTVSSPVQTSEYGWILELRTRQLPWYYSNSTRGLSEETEIHILNFFLSHDYQ